MPTRIEFTSASLVANECMAPVRLAVLEDGGIISSCDMSMGLGGRNIERLLSRLPIVHATDYAEKIDHFSAPAYAYLAAAAFEEVLGVEIPERSAWIRMILLELSRIRSHLFFLINVSRCLGQLGVMNYCIREADTVSELFEMYCGSRAGFGAVCLGGVRQDASDGFFYQIDKVRGSIVALMQEVQFGLIEQPLSQFRLKGLMRLDADRAKEIGLSGPNARASGLDSDVRSELPYLFYGRVERKSRSVAATGDCLARISARMDDIVDSLEVIASVFSMIPRGSHRIRFRPDIMLPEGKTSSKSVETARGKAVLDLDCGLMGRGPSFGFRPPSAGVVGSLPGLLAGLHLEDVFLAIHSLDISFAEVDR